VSGQRLGDTSNFIILRYGSDELKRKLVPRLLSQDPAEQWKGTQFMTEKSGGSDVGALETEARQENGEWRLYGEKWFCSHTDADLALILARPQSAATGTRGLGLFAMPRRLEDGGRNRYRIVRLKNKLGTRSMASGEIRLEGAFAWQVSELRAGFKQMLDQVNLSRLSHGVRAAAMMRRCLNEALCVARNRIAFGRALIEMSLVRRQLLKLMVPAEQALSMYAWTADVMNRANHADEGAVHLLRILTPLFKFRACRDNLRVATGAMEVRGGNGYIEDWINPRLVRDAQIGVLWEGTSNINALDAIGRAAAKMGAHEALGAALRARLAEASRVPQKFRSRLGEAIDRAVAFAARASGAEGERLARMAAGALYNAATAVLMAWEAARLDNGRRLLLSRMVVEHRLSAQDPLAPPDGAWEERAAVMLLGEEAVPFEQAAAVINS
jgi:acyl-CoA dehydrogenase